jgi:hypothetical protein
MLMEFTPLALNNFLEELFDHPDFGPQVAKLMMTGMKEKILQKSQGHKMSRLRYLENKVSELSRDKSRLEAQLIESMDPSTDKLIIRSPLSLELNQGDGGTFSFRSRYGRVYHSLGELETEVSSLKVIVESCNQELITAIETAQLQPTNWKEDLGIVYPVRPFISVDGQQIKAGKEPFREVLKEFHTRLDLLLYLNRELQASRRRQANGGNPLS